MLEENICSLREMKKSSIYLKVKIVSSFDDIFYKKLRFINFEVNNDMESIWKKR